jgi:DNA-binding SARP family transcriptional activator/tetratricopeptide (TPR) repeat protein
MEGGERPVFVGLLGSVELGAGIEVRRPALRVLLAVLALSANRMVTADALIRALWGEDAERRAGNLQAHVYQLRLLLEAVEPGRARSRLLTAGGGYRLELSDGELDVAVFGQLARRGRELALAGEPLRAGVVLREALGVWRGPALADAAGLSVRLAAEAAGLEESRLSVLEDRIDVDLAAGLQGDLVGELTALVAAHPLRERLRGQLMTALFRDGRPGDALECYRAGRQLLADELGLDPGSALQALQTRIGADRVIAGTVVPDATSSIPALSSLVAAVVPRQLPARPRFFTGREPELKQLDALLDPAADGGGTVVISALTGGGGVGKTTLAVHWAHQAADRFPDGQLYVNLRGFDPASPPATPAEAIRGFLDAFGIPGERMPVTEAGQAGLYRSLIAGRRMVVVLDNAGEAAQVRPLLPASPGCLVLITSRSALTGLATADGATRIALDLLDAEAAARLLAARLGPERLAAEPEATAKLIGLCAGLPLALAITAARAAASADLPIGVLAAQMAGEQARLDALDTGEEATSARAVFSWSYQRLPAPASRMFRLLGVHPGPDISVPAAASLAGTEPREARRLLTELTSASMLGERLAGRYAFHDLLRAYAAERASITESEQERHEVTGRILDHYRAAADHASALEDAAYPSVWLPATPPARHTQGTGVTAEPLADVAEAAAWFQAEHKVLMAVTVLAAQADFSVHGWQIPWTLRGYLMRTGHWDDWATMNQIALACADRSGDQRAQGRARFMVGMLALQSGAYDEGVVQFSEAEKLFGADGISYGRQGSLANTSICLTETGHYAEALGVCQTALDICRTRGDHAGESDIVAHLGLIYARLGEHDLALANARAAAAMTAGTADFRYANAVEMLGHVLLLTGDHAAASDRLSEAASLMRQFGHRYEEACCTLGLGDARNAAGDSQAAHAAWRRGLDLLGDMHHPDAARIRALLDGASTGPVGH